MPRTATDLRDYLSDGLSFRPGHDPAGAARPGRDGRAPRPPAPSERRRDVQPVLRRHVGAAAVRGLRLPEASAIEAGPLISALFVRGFIRENHRLLLDPRNNVGTWYNVTEDETYLDVSTALPEREEAFTLAVRCNQIAFYDLAQGDAIPTFGTGENTVDLPPEDERLPPLDQVRRSNNDGNDNAGSHQGNGHRDHG